MNILCRKWIYFNFSYTYMFIKFCTPLKWYTKRNTRCFSLYQNDCIINKTIKDIYALTNEKRRVDGRDCLWYRNLNLSYFMYYIYTIKSQIPCLYCQRCYTIREFRCERYLRTLLHQNINSFMDYLSKRCNVINAKR